MVLEMVFQVTNACLKENPACQKFLSTFAVFLVEADLTFWDTSSFFSPLWEEEGTLF